MIYRCNLRYSLLVEGLFRYNASFIITLFLLGSHHERYNDFAVYTATQIIHIMNHIPIFWFLYLHYDTFNAQLVTLLSVNDTEISE